MKLYLQIEISRWNQGGFGNLMLNYASSLSGDIMGTDLDSQSEPVIAEMVIRMIHRADHIFLLVRSNDPNLPTGAAQRVLESLIEMENKVAFAVMCGDHRSSESALAAFHPRFTKETDPEKIKEMIREFSALTR